MLSSATGSTSMDAFDRMKEKVEMLESQAEVSAQLAGAPDASLEDKFKQLEAGDSVSDEARRARRAAASRTKTDSVSPRAASHFSA
jgi:phage shock protein A